MALRVGELGGLKIRLADWKDPEQRYQRRYLPVDPESETVGGDRPGLSANPQGRLFVVRSWRGGEGLTSWERDKRQYRQSTNVRPVSIQDGLVLGARQTVTPPDGGSGTFNDGRRFGFGDIGSGGGLTRLWVADDGDAYPWNPTDSEWDASISTGATTNDVIAMTSGEDITWMYSSHADGSIRRFQAGPTIETHVAASTFSEPFLCTFNGVLYALDGQSLYEVDQSTANTVTERADVGSQGLNSPDYQPLAVSDRGPVWLHRSFTGGTEVWLYDPNGDHQEKIGQVSQGNIFAYSIWASHGFVFVGFRTGARHALPGDAYIWFRRGAQTGYAGPIRSLSGSTASKPILIAGVIGDDLIFYFDGAVWAYNLTDGAIYMMATQTTTGTPSHAVVYGADVFIAPVTSSSNTLAVERFNTRQYTTEDASIDLGKHDFDYPGMVKILTDVTVITDPLPANTTLQVAISADGAAFATLSTTASTDGATRHRFPVSTSAGSTVSGMEFEIRLIPDSTSATATPTIREVSARATGSEHVLEIVMVLDAGPIGDQTSETFLTGMRALAEPATPEVQSFTDPMQLREHVTPLTFDVTIEEVILPEILDDHVNDALSAQVRVRGVELV